MEPDIGSERSDYNPSRAWRKAYGISDAEVDVHGFINLEFTKAKPEAAYDRHPAFDRSFRGTSTNSASWSRATSAQ